MGCGRCPRRKGPDERLGADGVVLAPMPHTLAGVAEAEGRGGTGVQPMINDDFVFFDVGTLSEKLGQLIRANELKVAGKLLASARGHLHELAGKEPVFAARYEHVAELRNELMEPGCADFDEKRLLLGLIQEERELRALVSKHHSEPAVLAHTLLKAAAAIVLVYCQAREFHAPLDI